MKEASDPKLDGFMRVEEVVECLATGWTLRCERGTDYDADEWWVMKGAGKVRDDTMRRLLAEGWITQYGAGSLRLSDAGHKAYMRSTDELQDGRLIAPSATDNGGDRHD